MNTLAKTNRGAVTVHIRKVTVARIAPFWTELETSRFALIPMILVVIGCIGGIAAGFGTDDSAFQIAVVAIGTVIPLALLLAVSPMKPVFYLSVAAIIIDLLVLVF